MIGRRPMARPVLVVAVARMQRCREMLMGGAPQSRKPGRGAEGGLKVARWWWCEEAVRAQNEEEAACSRVVCSV